MKTKSEPRWKSRPLLTPHFPPLGDIVHALQVWCGGCGRVLEVGCDARRPDWREMALWAARTGGWKEDFDYGFLCDRCLTKERP